MTFIEQYKQAAVEAAAGTKIFPETILSAAALESGHGQSMLAAKYNNFFGIKAEGSWGGRKVILPTHEQDAKGKVYTVNAAFRWYETPQDSFRNYVKFISGPRYVKAGIMEATTPQEQFEALHRAGYATDISYVQKLKNMLTSFGDFVTNSPAASGGIGIAIVFFCS